MRIGVLQLQQQQQRLCWAAAAAAPACCKARTSCWASSAIALAGSAICHLIFTVVKEKRIDKIANIGLNNQVWLLGDYARSAAKY